MSTKREAIASERKAFADLPDLGAGDILDRLAGRAVRRKRDDFGMRMHREKTQELGPRVAGRPQDRDSGLAVRLSHVHPLTTKTKGAPRGAPL
jgi:hypothetical protein